MNADLLTKYLIPIIGIPVPPFLARALGYDGDGRYLSFFWHYNNDTLIFKDGVFGLVGGNDEAYDLYVSHDKVYPFFKNYNLGDLDDVAEDAIVLDTVENRLHVGNRDDVDTFFDELRNLNELPANPLAKDNLNSILMVGKKLKRLTSKDINIEGVTENMSPEEKLNNYYKTNPGKPVSDKEDALIDAEYSEYCRKLYSWLEGY